MLVKRTEEKRLYSLDFSLQPEFDLESDSLSTVDSVTSIPTGLTITSPAKKDNHRAEAWIEGGTNEVTYTVKFNVTTTQGVTLVGSLLLLVSDPWADEEA